MGGMEEIRCDWQPGPNGPVPTVDYRHARLAIDLVDDIAARAGFDPEELVDPRTGATFGPFLAHVKAALLVQAALAAAPDDDES